MEETLPVSTPQKRRGRPKKTDVVASDPNHELRMELWDMQFGYLFERVLKAISGGCTLKGYLEEVDGRYDAVNYLRWIHKDPERRARYEYAQLLNCEFIAADLIKISDAEDSMEDVNRSRLRIDTRKWLLSMYNRKRYGESKTVEIGGSINIKSVLEEANRRVIEHIVDDVEDVEES